MVRHKYVIVKQSKITKTSQQPKNKKKSTNLLVIKICNKKNKKQVYYKTEELNIRASNKTFSYHFWVSKTYN